MSAVILHIETSGSTCSVAISSESQLIVEICDNGPYSHNAKLISLIDQALKETKISIDKICAISINLGPGSFTGLRIGMSTAKGLAFAHNTPLIGVNSFEILASTQNTNTCIPIISANSRGFYFQRFKKGHPSSLPSVSLANNIIINDETIIGTDIEDFSKKTSLLGFDSKQVELKASLMLDLSLQRYISKNFLDLAYSSPLYIQEPFIKKGKSKF